MDFLSVPSARAGPSRDSRCKYLNGVMEIPIMLSEPGM